MVNWVFDTESGTVGGTTDIQGVPSPASSDGTLSSASYVPVLAVYFRPFSTAFCPAGTIAGPYQCDFRTSSASGSTSSFTIPSNLSAIFAKSWGAGGGGYDPTGTSNDTTAGSGGFSQGLIQSINATAVAGLSVNVYAGGYGTGSAVRAAGGGGAAGSGVFTSLGVAGLVAGGGGGASSSDHNVGGSGNCSTATDAARCGLGGGGGGASALTSRAPDESSNCGGRGGDNSPSGANPPGGDCADGGGDGSGFVGGPTAGSTGGLGGLPAFIAGGRGYNAVDADGTPAGSAIGSGGGGGGALGGEAGGYDDNNNTRGYGGGGGSGFAGTGVVNASGATGSGGGTFTDTSRTGDPSNNTFVVNDISPALTGTWVVGYSISGNGIPAGSTIATIDPSNTSITISQLCTNNANNVALTVTNAGSTSGGNADPYYSPSYLGTSLQNPGRGGTTGTSVDGRGGAVVLLW